MDNVCHIEDRVSWLDCDLTDPVGTREMIETAAPDWIFHCAAETSSVLRGNIRTVI